MLRAGRESDAVRYVMESYRFALAAYFAGSSFRHRFPNDESADSAVNQFFGDQMLRPGFLSSWLNAQSRFRYWLLVSFVNHMRHRLRRERSEMKRREELPKRQQRAPRDQVRDRFDADVARGLVRSAVQLAEEACAREGRTEDWQTFMDHFLNDRPYNEIAARDGLSYRQVANRVRFAQKRLVEGLKTLLSTSRTADPNTMRQELSHMLEVIERCRS